MTHSLARPRRCPWGGPCHTLSANTSVAYTAAMGGSLNEASPLGRLGCPVHGAGAALVKATSGVRSGLIGSVVGAGQPQPRRRGQSWNAPGLRRDPESPGHREWGRKSIMDFRCGAPVTQTRDANTSTIRGEVRPSRSSGRSTSTEQVPCVTMGSHPPPEAFLSDSIKGWPTT